MCWLVCQRGRLPPAEFQLLGGVILVLLQVEVNLVHTDAWQHDEETAGTAKEA